MHRRTTRLNRITFVLLGVLLLAIGAFAIVRYEGWFDALPTFERLYSRPEARWLHDHDWIWYVVAAVAIVVGLLALRWLTVQTRIDRLRALRLDPDDRQEGRTLMATDVVTDAVEDDVADYPGVDGVRALLIGAVDAPELILRVSAHPVSDLARIHGQIRDEALPALREALDAPELAAQVHLHVAGRKAERRIVL